jgi:hypothetical protein
MHTIICNQNEKMDEKQEIQIIMFDEVEIIILCKLIQNEIILLINLKHKDL